EYRGEGSPSARPSPRRTYHDGMNDTAARPSRWLDFFREPLRRVQDESRAYLASEAGRRPDGKVIVVLVTATLALLVQHFVGKDSGITLARDLLRNAGLTRLSEDLWDAMWGGPEPQARLNRLRWWGWISLLVYVAVPMLLVR